MQALYSGDVYEGFMSSCAPDLQGWNRTEPILAELVAQHRPTVIVDVGVWKGASTIHFAELLHRNRIDGVVIAVDTFLGSPEHWRGGHEAQHIGRRWHGRPALYEQFLANVIDRDVAGYVVPMPQTSTNAAAILSRLGIQVDLVHIDAAHDYQSVIQDARAYWALLRPGGALVGDDYTSTWRDVMRAADQFVAEVGCDLTDANPKWIVRKP